MKQERILIAMVMIMSMGRPDLYSQPVKVIPDILVSTDWLENNLSDPSMVILHYGNKARFERGHIPNARLISLKDVIEDIENGLKHELPDDLSIEQTMRSWGINNDSKIIISYDDDEALTLAARLYFTFDYAGLGNRTAILNGGFPAWKSEHKALAKEGPDFAEGTIRIRPDSSLVTDKNRVYSNLNNDHVVIIDARPENIYSGATKDRNEPRNGHIEGAVNIPFSSLSTAESPPHLKKKNELRKLFVDQGIGPGQTLVAYCDSGLLASLVYFAAKLVGYKVRLYDASYQEWRNDDTLPIN